MPNKIENKMTYEETLERATMTPREEEFRKILRESRQGLSTDREAYISTCKLLGVKVALNDPWWIVIERDSGSDLAVGPFPTEAMAAAESDAGWMLPSIIMSTMPKSEPMNSSRSTGQAMRMTFRRLSCRLMGPLIAFGCSVMALSPLS